MNSSTFELTMEQQFQMKLLENSAEQMSPEQMREFLIQTTRLMMVKDNIIRELMRGCLI